jgi:hypothetical protein
MKPDSGIELSPVVDGYRNFSEACARRHGRDEMPEAFNVTWRWIKSL